jgi:hypothetical protein
MPRQIFLIAVAFVVFLAVAFTTVITFGGGSFLFAVPLVGSIGMARLLLVLMTDLVTHRYPRTPKLFGLTLAFGIAYPIAWAFWLAGKK